MSKYLLTSQIGIINIGKNYQTIAIRHSQLCIKYPNFYLLGLNILFNSIVRPILTSGGRARAPSPWATLCN